MIIDNETLGEKLLRVLIALPLSILLANGVLYILTPYKEVKTPGYELVITHKTLGDIIRETYNDIKKHLGY